MEQESEKLPGNVNQPSVSEPQASFDGPKLDPHHRVHTTVAVLIITAAVAAVGYWAWSSMPNICCPLPDRYPEPIAQDQTASWKTYRNEEYGFEIKIPSDWTVVKDGYLWFNSPESESDQYDEFGSEMYFSNTDPFNTDVSLGVPIIDKQTVVIAGREWSRILSDGLASDITYQLKAGGKIYNFSTVDTDEQLKQILPTFKFIK